MDEQSARTVWEGSIGKTPLRVDVLPSGRIAATWRVAGSERRSVVQTIEQFERTVLFQLMISAPPEHDSVASEVIAAVEKARVDLPDPATLPRTRRSRSRPQPQRRRRPGGRR
ncbi:MAG TPA: hypothetical protein VGS09_04265 [Actinomycetota bacterium]|jgi:hypothetical protein|nr:hypothetical protein [Actinomycetota bacterium]